ncbi:hypothetical protein DFR76_115126 [Nocardia pseudobrasiliensis]|uniref:Glycosyl transferase family 4 n=1 Tax=Nocardia pseudobrasiliensis TaxID=45979 RepID=A0A370HPJ1_9NOCA|nr:hypothetical protein DFR76_115126 [Nocardia pseudobrasiliensis]
MRIGLIAPPWVPVPPPAYGGTEAVDNQARGLTELGHDVRLFTVGESTCPVPREYLYDSPRSGWRYRRRPTCWPRTSRSRVSTSFTITPRWGR